MGEKKYKQGTVAKDQTVADLFGGMQISNKESGEDDAMGPMCGLMYSANSGVRICCDNWYNLKCTKTQGRGNIPATFYCENCQ